MTHTLKYLLTLVFAVVLTLPLAASDVGMFGGSPERNMVSDATGLPSSWDPASGQNVKWKQELGSQSYGGPVVAEGLVFVGTNNEAQKNPDIEGDKGVVMVFDADTGEFLWQSAHDKLPAGRVHDWPLQGVCSAPVVEDGKIYYVSNRAEVVAADIDGFRDGSNDGSVQDEAHAGETAEDMLWKLDMIGDLDVFPHNLAAGSPLVAGDLLFTVTGNGVDEGHVNVPSPLAPSFLAINKNSGELVWESDLPGRNILHGQWSNPAYGTIGGKDQVIFPGGDGWVYGMNPANGEVIWRFDANPKDSIWELGGAGTRNSIISTPIVYGDRVFIGVGQDPEHGEGEGHFWAIDATQTGDISESGIIWHRGGEDFHRTISTAAIHDGVLYISDLTGFLYALDAETGEHHWTYDTFAAVWGSAYVADGKVYIGDEDGDLAVLKAGTEMELLEEINMGSAIYTTPFAKNGILYVATRNMLFALQEGAGSS